MGATTRCERGNPPLYPCGLHECLSDCLSSGSTLHTSASRGDQGVESSDHIAFVLTQCPLRHVLIELHLRRNHDHVSLQWADTLTVRSLFAARARPCIRSRVQPSVACSRVPERVNAEPGQ